MFVNFIKPFLDFIDNGNFFRKPFKWLYGIIAVLNLLFPIYIIISAISENLFRSQGKFIAWFFIFWLILCLIGWLSFQLWWNRKDKVSEITNENDEFVSTPVFSHLIQTAGEWMGMYVAISGSLGTLFTILILGNAKYAGRYVGGVFSDYGWLSIILAPIVGFLIIVATKFIAEQFKALSAIANNTKK